MSESARSNLTEGATDIVAPRSSESWRTHQTQHDLATLVGNVSTRFEMFSTYKTPNTDVFLTHFFSFKDLVDLGSTWDLS